MLFVIVGLALLVAHFAGLGPMAHWNWDLFGDLWKFVLPFVLAVLWWGFADASGLTRKRAMDKDDARKAERQRRNVEALGLGPAKDQGKRGR